MVSQRLSALELQKHMAGLIIHPLGTGHSDVKADIKYRRSWIYDQLRLRFYIHRVLHTFRRPNTER
jgi:hypothetical protein